MKAADDFDVTVDDVTNVQTSGTTANVDAIRGTRFATTLRGYGPSSPNLDKIIKIDFGKEDIFVDFKHQFLAALEGKRLKRFITDRSYNLSLPENHEERLQQVFVYNCIAASLRAGGRFPVIREVEDCNAYSAWQKVLERFEGQTAVTSMAIKAQVWGRKLQEGESLTQLCDWLTERFQMLSATPERMGEIDKKLVLVMAIEKHPRYERIAATIRHDTSVLTFEHAVDMVRDEVRYLDVLHAEEKLSNNVNTVSQSKDATGKGDTKKSLKIAKAERRRDKQRQHGRGRSKSRDRGDRRRKQSPWRRRNDEQSDGDSDDAEKQRRFEENRCFVCGKKGHYAADCWQRDDGDNGDRRGRNRREPGKEEVSGAARRMVKLDLNVLSNSPPQANLWSETGEDDDFISGDEFVSDLHAYLFSNQFLVDHCSDGEVNQNGGPLQNGNTNEHINDAKQQGTAGRKAMHEEQH